MDKLSKFLIDSYNAPSNQPAPPSGSFVEPSILEKRAYMKASMGSSMDQDFLARFEGTPLAPQAVALAEQELSMQSQQLQKRMQRDAQRKMDDTWEQDCLAQDAIALQKQQLLLQLYKMKAMTPTPQPGDAAIGEPQPQMQPAMPPQPAGAEAGAPVPEPKVAALVDNPLLNPIGSQIRKARAQKTAALDTRSLLQEYRGLDVDNDEPRTELLELGGHPGLPVEARKAILQKYLEHRANAPVRSPQGALSEVQAERGGTGAAIGAGIGLPVGALGGGFLAHAVRRPALAELGAGAGALLGGVGGGMLGYGIGKSTATPAHADKLIAEAQAHQAAVKPLLSDPLGQEQMLHHLTAQHYQNQLEGMMRRDEEGAYNGYDPNYYGKQKKAAAIRAYAARLKTAGSAERGYMHEAGEAAGGVVDRIKDHPHAGKALRMAIPAAFGAVSGAEGVPENRLLGAAGGALGGVGGSELGGFGGQRTAKSLGFGPTGQSVGALLGHLIGANAGIDLGTRGARLLAT